MQTRIIERAENGLPLIVEVESPYPFISQNGRQWDLESLREMAARTNRVLEQGARLPNLLRHPEDDYVRIVYAPDITPQKEYVPSKNPEISDPLAYWIDDKTNNLVSRVRFKHDTPEGRDWAGRADRGEWLPTSIRVEANCQKTEGTQLPLCKGLPDALLFNDWLNPDLGEEPGIKGSGFTRIIEVHAQPCAARTEHADKANCNCGGECDPCKQTALEHAHKTSQTKTYRPLEQAGEKRSGGLTTKGAKDMAIKDFIAKLAATKDDKTRAAMADTANLFLGGDEPEEVPEMPEPPDDAMAETSPEEYEKQLEAYNAAKKALLKKKTESARPAPVAVTTQKVVPVVFDPQKIKEANAAAAGMTVEEYEEDCRQRKAELDRKKILSTLTTEVNTARANKSLFESHPIDNVELYPVPEVQAAIETVAGQSKTVEVARERLGVRLEKISNDILKAKADEVVKTEAANKAAQGALDITGAVVQVGISRKYREQSEKVVKLLVDICEKYAPELWAEYQKSKKNHLLHMQAHSAAIHHASEITYREKLEQSSRFIESGGRLSEAATNSSNMLNAPVFLDGAMEFIYWASPVMRLVSALPTDAINVGPMQRITGTNKFAQFVQVKSRERNQRRNFHPLRKITSTAQTHQMQIHESQEQFFATRETSSIKLDRALIDYLKADPMFENVPNVLIAHLIQELAMFRQLKVSMELLMSAHRYKLLTITNETTQDVSGERTTSVTDGVTFGGITFPNARAAVWMRRGIASGGTVTFGPVMTPRNVPAINVFGVISETTQYPVNINAVNGITQVQGDLDENYNIVPINEGDEPTFAVHPKGIAVFNEASGVTAAVITAGGLVFAQYSKVRNYAPISVALPGSTERSVWGRRKVEEIGIIRSDVVTLRNAQKPDYLLYPEAVFDKVPAFADSIQSANLIEGLDFAKINPSYGSDGEFSGMSYRGAEILTTNEPLLGQSGLFAVMGKKGRTVCQQLEMPQLSPEWPVYATDEDGITGITDETTQILSETTFIQTISPRDPDPDSDTYGEYKEYSQTSMFFTDTPESSGIIA